LGGAGNDNYIFDADNVNERDSVDDNMSSGIDTLRFSKTSAGINVELHLLGLDQTVNGNLILFLSQGSRIERIVGGSGNDFLVGSGDESIINEIYGGPGNDYITGLQGNDWLWGGDGNDELIEVWGGQNFMFGNGGNDRLQSGESHDQMYGNDGDDRFYGRGGNDLQVGGEGNDSYFFKADELSGSDTIEDTGGIDFLNFSDTTGQSISVDLALSNNQQINSFLTINLSSGESIEGVVGGSLDDTIRGNGLANILMGLNGNDTIIGAAGRDMIFGGNGADNLSGEGDLDLLIAGTTSYDLDVAFFNSSSTANLVLMRGVWVSVDSYSVRSNKLRTGSGVPKLAAGETVFGDSSTDSLTGNVDQDWFFAQLNEVTDKAADETVDVI
jgi:Ca2+-binding RTX toxin-like protein